MLLYNFKKSGINIFCCIGIAHGRWVVSEYGAYRSVCMRIYISILCELVCASYVYVYAYEHAQLYEYVVHEQVYACVYVYVYVCVHVYVYVHVNASAWIFKWIVTIQTVIKQSEKYICGNGTLMTSHKLSFYHAHLVEFGVFCGLELFQHFKT